MSSQFKIENEIPQGSVISFVLFYIMINYIFRDVNRVISASLYVDDEQFGKEGEMLTICFTDS